MTRLIACLSSGTTSGASLVLFCLHFPKLDRRPDYQKLHILRQNFPRVPIMALSATCPPKVLEDLLRTLGMKPVVDGTSAPSRFPLSLFKPNYRRKNKCHSVLFRSTISQEPPLPNIAQALFRSGRNHRHEGLHLGKPPESNRNCILLHKKSNMSPHLPHPAR